MSRLSPRTVRHFAFFYIQSDFGRLVFLYQRLLRSAIPMPNNTTLRRELTQGKPALRCVLGPQRNTRNRYWPAVAGLDIELWEEFQLTTLNESYSHVLDVDIPANSIAVPQAEDFFADGSVLNTPKDLARLVAWNDRVVRPTLDVAKNHQGLHAGLQLRSEMWTPGSRSQDHVISLDDSPLQNLVVGISRPSYMFPARGVANNPARASKEALWPLRQLAHFCDEADTRYGYIITEQDFLACCFYKPDIGISDWKVDVMAIPWTRATERQLTTDAALWWLCMLGLSAPEHRKLVRKDEAVSIAQWKEGSVRRATICRGVASDGLDQPQLSSDLDCDGQ